MKWKKFKQHVHDYSIFILCTIACLMLFGVTVLLAWVVEKL
jgi:hypothetical protein